MWIRKSEYEELVNELKYKTDKIKDLEDESGVAMLKRLKGLAKECGIETHGDEYQTFMSRMFMAVAGRESNEAKAYSSVAFLKDNPEELLVRLEKLMKNKSVITRIEDKSKKWKKHKLFKLAIPKKE